MAYVWATSMQILSGESKPIRLRMGATRPGWKGEAATAFLDQLLTDPDAERLCQSLGIMSCMWTHQLGVHGMLRLVDMM